MLTESKSFPRGALAPDFSLTDTISDDIFSFDDIAGEKGTVVAFICNHCPFVLHINSKLVELAQQYQEKGIGFVAISSNDVNYVPEDGPEYMKKHAQAVGYPFPYLYDETQDIARSYDAACTPDFYVFDAEKKSVYHGRLDASTPGNGVDVTGSDMRGVLDCLVSGEGYVGDEFPSMGCNIKWK